MGGLRQRARVRLGRAAVLRRDDDRRKPAERGQAADPPLPGLFTIEPLRVAGHERRDDGMFRLPCLQECVSGLSPRPARPVA